MSLVLAFDHRDLNAMITREQGDVVDLVAALNEVRESIRVLDTGLPQTQSVLASLRVAASRLDSAIRSGNDKISRWTELLRQIQAR